MRQVQTGLVPVRTLDRPESQDPQVRFHVK